MPAAEVGNLLLDGLELDIEFVSEGFPGQGGVIYQGVDDALGCFSEGTGFYRGTISGYGGRFCGYRVLSFVGETPLFNQLGELLVCDAVVDIGDNGMEGGLVGTEGRLLVCSVSVQLGSECEDFPEAGAAFFHIVHLREDIGNDGVAPQRRYGVDVKVLDECAVDHSAGCGEFDAIVVDVDVEFSAHNCVLAMDQVIDEDLGDGPLGVFREVEPIGWKLVPALGGVGFDEVLTVFQEADDITLEFGIVDGVIFMQAAPSGADYAGLIDGAFIGEEEAGIGEETVGRDKTKRGKEFLFKGLLRLLEVGFCQQDEGFVRALDIAHKGIPGLVCAAKDEFSECVGVGRDAFVSHPDIRHTASVKKDIIGREVAGFNRDLHYVLTVFQFVGYKPEARHGVEMSLDFLADEFSDCLRVIYSYNVAFLVHPVEEAAAIGVGESADALEPVANLFLFKFSLEVVCSAFGNEYVVFYPHINLPCKGKTYPVKREKFPCKLPCKVNGFARNRQILLTKVGGDAGDVEGDDGLLAFFAEEEGAVGLVVHE